MKRTRLPVRAVVFDWDGTLLNSYSADARAYLAMFRALKIDWDLDDLARHYSPNWYRVYRAARLPRSMWGKADQLWTRAYGKESPPCFPARATSSEPSNAIFFSASSPVEIAGASADNCASLSSRTIFRPVFAVKMRRRRSHIPRGWNWRSNGSEQNRENACMSAILPKTSRWLAVPVFCPSAFLVLFLRPSAYALQGRRRYCLQYANSPDIWKG